MAQAEILLIEDEATSRAILETVLTDAGYCVDTAETAALAYSRLQAARYALVIADWLLPDGDGIYIADRAAARGSRTLVVTGHLSDLPVGTASRHHILMKPTKPESLLALVRALIGGPADQR
jgi:DNA-binding response OmpR family regulator